MKKSHSTSLIIPCFIAFILLFCLICTLFILIHGMLFSSGQAASTVYNTPPTVIIDAGHGGEDGGAIGIDGTYEKDINLLIAKKLKIFLESMGVRTILTRTQDILLYNRNEDYHGRKKILDAKERKRIAESYEDAIFVSIHQNAYPVEKYKGFQVYYSSNNSASQVLASAIENDLRASLQKENNRHSFASNGSIYLLDELKCPAVLIECGFLSNSEECALLSNDDYQNKLCAVIASSVMDFISKSRA